MSVRSSVFWDVTQCRLGVSDGRIGTAYRSRLDVFEGGTDRLCRNFVATDLRCVSSQQNEHIKTGIFCEKLKPLIFRSVNALFWDFDTSECRSEIPGNLGNVVLEKDGRDDLDRSCEK